MTAGNGGVITGELVLRVPDVQTSWNRLGPGRDYSLASPELPADAFDLGALARTRRLLAAIEEGLDALVERIDDWRGEQLRNDAILRMLLAMPPSGGDRQKVRSGVRGMSC